MGFLKSGKHEKKRGVFVPVVFTNLDKITGYRTVYLATLPVFCGNEARNGFPRGGGVGIRIASNVHTKVPDAVK